jgi:hypothetical protein
MVFRRSTAAGGDARQVDLDVYDVAFLVGGAHRVADCAVIASAGRGLVGVRAARVRALGGELPTHPVERALVTSCARSRSLVVVHTALQRSPEVEEIGRRLAAAGLVTGSRRRLTRAGRRRLRAARQDVSPALPGYVFDGPAVLQEGPVRRGVTATHAVPSGLGRALVRMGKALDRAFDHDDSTSDSGSGGFSCGGGGGGGD